MGSPAPAVRAGDRDAGAEIDLGLVAGGALQTPERQRLALAQPADEAADAVVLARGAMVADQILVDALGRQPGLELVEDELAPRLAQAGLASRVGSGRARAERRLGRF